MAESGKDRLVRHHIVFSGRVQGVGFRYRAMYAAQSLGLTGWVKNDWDGSVVMEVQGRQSQIDQMIGMIQQGSYIYIEDIKLKKIPLTEDERSFKIRGY